MKGLCVFLVFFMAAATMHAQTLTTQERNKQVSRDFFEVVLDQGRLDRYAESHAADFVAHGSNHDATLAEDMAAARDERKALPDMRMKVNRLVAEGDLVAVHWTASGTNTGEGMGFPATGKKITTDGITIFRFVDGKIKEEWSAWDMLSVMQQAGLYPASAH